MRSDATDNESSRRSLKITAHYPTWQTVRRNYYRRRQASHGKLNHDQDIPEKLQVTKKGSYKLLFGRKISEDDM